MKKIRTILIGTPEFATRIFRKFLKAKLPNFEVVGVVTAVDKPVGRKQELTPSPIKKWALGVKLPVLQIEKIKKINADLIIAAAYGQIIPNQILEIVNPRLGRTKFGALNIHPSLLPKYRGASPIQTAILNGDKETGITIILMDEKIDHGPIVSSSKFQVSSLKLTYNELSEKLADLGADLLIKTLPNWIEGKIKPQPQDHSKATFTKIIKKEDGKIDWNKSAEEIERMIRALDPWPGTFAFWNNKQLKMLKADADKKPRKSRHNVGARGKAGEVFLTEDKGLAVQTGNGILILKQVQLEGKRVMPAKDFLNGHPRIIGAILK